MNSVLPKYFGHSKSNTSSDFWQPLIGTPDSHIDNVVKLVSKFANKFGAKDAGELVARVHDVPKSSKEFTAYLYGENGIENDLTRKYYRKDQKVNHTIGGTQFLLNNYGRKGKLLSYCCLGHHGGLPNWTELTQRIKLPIPEFDHSLFPTVSDLSLPSLIPNPSFPFFHYQFFIRMLFSCLVDADFLDTESSMDARRSAERARIYDSMKTLLERLLKYHKKLMKKSLPSEINKIRNEIFNMCQTAANMNPGFFSLSAPTGGGKTLSSLIFAFLHAILYGKERIFYIAPFTTILDQNYEIFCKIFNRKNVLEHQSSFDFVENGKFNFAAKLASENWDCPIIASTNVQLFDSLYSNMPSVCRKLHNLANSVIILDEAHAFPIGRMQQVIAVMQELVNNYSVTFLLCTATQPPIENRERLPFGLKNVREIIDKPFDLSKRTVRNRCTYLRNPLTIETLAGRLGKHKQALCVVNTKKQAAFLFKKIRSLKIKAYHLSADMCHAQRISVLKRVMGRLKKGKDVICISTQLIEAGVDIDFPVCYRAMAGLDNTGQTNGRCNREGKLKYGETFVFDIYDYAPKGGHLKQTADIARGIINGITDHNDILKPETVRKYYECLYSINFYDTDKDDIIRSLKNSGPSIEFQFEEISKFSLIDSPSCSIIIPYNKEAISLIEKIRLKTATYLTFRKIRKYCVNVKPKQLEKLVEDGAVEILDEKFPCLIDESLYDKDLGLFLDNE